MGSFQRKSLIIEISAKTGKEQTQNRACSFYLVFPHKSLRFLQLKQLYAEYFSAAPAFIVLIFLMK